MKILVLNVIAMCCSMQAMACPARNAIEGQSSTPILEQQALAVARAAIAFQSSAEIARKPSALHPVAESKSSNPSTKNR